MRTFWMFSLILIPALSRAAPSEVLLIGDSQSYGSFGTTILQDLRSEKKIRTSLYSRPGSTASWWISGQRAPEPWGSLDAPQDEPEWRTPEARDTPKIGDLIQKHDPRVVAVVLGGNMVKESDEKIKESVAAVAAKILDNGRDCLWVGPPPGDKRPQPRFDELYVLLKTEATKNGCRFIDSREIVKPAPTGGDGIHLDTMKDGLKAAKKWSESIAQEIAKTLASSQAKAAPRASSKKH
jgi:hypothetical protein